MKSMYSKYLSQSSFGNLNSVGLKGTAFNNSGNGTFRTRNLNFADSLTFQGEPKSTPKSPKKQKKYGFFQKRVQAILHPLFMKALSTQNQFWVEKLLKWGADPNAKDDFGCTPLARAFALDNLSIAKLLLAANADPNCKGGDGHPLIHSVFKEYHHAGVKTLLDAGADPNTRDFKGITLLQLACQKRASTNTLQRLLEYGANPNDAKNGTDLPLRTVLKAGLLEQAEVLLESGAKFQEPEGGLTSTELPLPILAMCAIKQEGNLRNAVTLDGQISRIISEFLKQGGSPNGVIPRNVMEPIDAFRRNNHLSVPLPESLKPISFLKKEDSLLMLALEFGLIDTARVLLLGGANPNYRNPLDHTTLVDKLSTSMSMLPLFSQTAPLVPDLLESSMNPNLQDHNGTPLLHQLAFWGNTLWLKMALQKGADPKSLDAYGRTALHRAAWRGNIEVAKILLQAGTPLNHSGPNESTANVEAAANGHHDLVDYLNRMGSDNPAWANLVIKAYYPIEEQPELLDFLPELLLKNTLAHITPLASRVERFFDSHEPQRGFHPHEAELMLLLKHPDLLERDPFKMAPFTRALTSITYFINENVPLSDAVTKAWGDIGFLSHGFRFWKFDTVGKDTLLESFGFKKLETIGDAHQAFGQGFGYEDKRLSPSQRPCFVFRRGCLMVSHPDAGTLVIRNSSKVFGRKLLKHPAYLIPKAYSLAELTALDPRQIPEDYHVLNKAWYTPKPKAEWQGQGAHRLPFLSDLLLGLKDEYRRFKLDTEAFEGTGADRHFTGHQSPGLVHLVNCLNTWRVEGKTLPDLAFVHPELPIYQPYTSLDEDLKKTDRFKMTPKHLKELTDFVSNQWSLQKYPESDWIRFLHQAGVENRAELVMIDPEKMD